ncbi:MAG: hypothetical protein [Circular genetic element sp.]|nr:MAG: hypothetical protein [Circular genetic element sp.]
MTHACRSCGRNIWPTGQCECPRQPAARAFLAPVKPTCLNRNRTTIKCRMSCCKKKAEPSAPQGRQIEFSWRIYNPNYTWNSSELDDID